MAKLAIFWKWLSNSALAQVLFAAGALFGYHKVQTHRARTQGERTGAEQERERIDQVEREETQRMKEKASEVREHTAGATDDELLERVRNQASRQRNG